MSSLAESPFAGSASPPGEFHTSLHVARVERLVELRLAAGGLDGPPVEPDIDDGHLLDLTGRLLVLEAEADEPPPLRLLKERFGLHRIELDTLVLVAAMELSERCSRLVATPRGGSRHGFVDPQVALAVFGGSPVEALAHFHRFEPDGILFRAGLLDAIPVRGFAPYHAARCLVPQPHLLAFLCGRRELGRDLSGVGERVVPQVDAADPPGLGVVVAELERTFAGFLRLFARLASDPTAARLGFDRALVIDLAGPVGSGRRLAVRAAARAVRRAVIELDGALLAGDESSSDRLRHAFKQAELYGELLHLRDTETLFERQPAAPAVLGDLTRRHPVICVVSHARQLPAVAAFDSVVISRVRTASFPPRDVARELWRLALPDYARLSDPSVAERLSTTVALAPGRIRQAARLATLWAAAEGGADAPVVLTHRTLDEAATAQRDTGLGELTSAEAPRATGQAMELVLSQKNLEEIEAIAKACANRMQVMREWGFERILRRGTGIICLFDGPPGTGKTLTAELIAQRLGLELHQINVSRIVDKYIGETEKNLEQVFARIVPDRTLLLFDEADSLFGTRVKVSTSTDRYANMAINTLLQLIERYSGIVVLTTNLKDAIDPAFERRITFKVVFEKPDADARERLWRAHLPQEAPVADDVDLELLADTFELSGGHIKNAVLRAALDSAHSGRITHEALYAQAVREASSMGLVVRRSQF